MSYYIYRTIVRVCERLNTALRDRMRKMDRTVCELFAGVGGFRCGLNSIKKIEDTQKEEKWKTVWFSQWEPGKTKQWAHDCYVNRFGVCLDLDGKDTTNVDIAEVNKKLIPDCNLLVGGFPCQDYSVAHSLASEKGIEGKKGVLWWSIYDILKEKKPPFVLLENVDRLLKSPSKQRGRDFGIILACFRNEGYIVEWRVINAAEYGNVQRRRRTFIFAYKKNTKFGTGIKKKNFDVTDAKEVITKVGFFAQTFPIEVIEEKQIKKPVELKEDVVEVSDGFHFLFENSGIMIDGTIYTAKTNPIKKKPVTLGEILEENADEKYFVSSERLFYTDPSVNRSDETEVELSKEQRSTWQYIKGAKKRLRTASTGHKYVFSEGPVAMVDEWDMPARTMLTSEGSFNRSTHIVRDKANGRIRILTPVETERIQGFPDDWTKECLMDGEVVPMTERMRYFCMGNALVVDLVTEMEKTIDKIFACE